MNTLKVALKNIPIITLSNFYEELVIETNSLRVRVGVVPTKQDKLLAFFNQPFSEHSCRKFGFKKTNDDRCSNINVESLFVRHPFIVNCDPKSLKLLMDQWVVASEYG